MFDTLWQYLLNQIHTNHFFTGAALGGVALASLNYLRQLGHWTVRVLIRRFTVAATVHSEDELYLPLAQWLDRFQFDRFARRYRIRVPDRDGDSPKLVGDRNSGDADQRGLQDAVFGPDYGTYTFRYERKWLRVSVSREGDGAGQNTSRKAQTREFLTISYIGVSRRLLDSIVGQAMVIAGEKRERDLPVQKATMYGWNNAGTLPRKPPAVCPVVLEGNLLQDIEADLERFLARRDWYMARGIPWRRGYLLHGPPGTGKTSLCRHLARRFDMGIYMVDSAGYLSDQLGGMLNSVNPRSLVLFEDIDCYDVANRRDISTAAPAESNKDENYSTIMRANIGTLLNAIDGVNPPEQLLVVMTSNRPEQLDPALIRPGRIDLRIHLDLCGTDQAVRLLDKFFPDATPAQRAAFAKSVPAGRYSPADLQERFIVAGDVDAVLASFRQPLHLVEDADA